MTDAPLDNTGRMTLVEHLTELRTRLIRCLLAVAIGAAAGWILYPQILDALMRPYCELDSEGVTAALRQIDASGSTCALYVRDPLEPLQLRLQISSYTGIAIAMPVLLWQVWKFIAPGLYPKEKRYAAPFVVTALALFALGAGLAYWTIPQALDFLVAIGGNDLDPLFSPAPYLKLVVYMMLAFGIGFEFPIVLVFLQLLGVVDDRQLASARRYAVIGIVALVALITPSGDPISLAALSIPMCLFYEASILFGRLRRRRQPTS